MRSLGEGQLTIAARLHVISDFFRTDPEDPAGALMEELRKPLGMPNFGNFYPLSNYAINPPEPPIPS